MSQNIVTKLLSDTSSLLTVFTIPTILKPFLIRFRMVLFSDTFLSEIFCTVSTAPVHSSGEKPRKYPVSLKTLHTTSQSRH